MKRIDTLFSRKAARIAAEDRILEVAALKPASVAGTLIHHPDLFRELTDDLAKTLVLSLIDRGQAECLRQPRAGAFSIPLLKSLCLPGESSLA